MSDTKRMILAAMAAGVIAFGMSRATACTADIGRANTQCYVRSCDTGDVVGSLYKGDTVVVTGKRGGWYRIDINGKEYRVWGEYLKVKHDICLDEVSITDKVRKSKSKESGLYGKTEHSIKGSAFDGIDPW